MTSTSTGCAWTPCTRSSDESEVHLLEELGDRGGRALGAPAPAAHADRGVRPQRRADGDAARGRRARRRRAVERRLPPRAARGADRRDQRLLRRLRAARRAGEGVRARLLPRRHLLVVPRPPPRRTRAHRDHAHLAAGGVQPEPRPGRQPRRRRPARPSTSTRTSCCARRCSPWPGRSRRCCSRARSGPRRHRSSSSPPTPSPTSARPPPRAGCASSSRWAGTRRSCPTRRTRRRSSARSSTGRSSTTEPHARVLAAYQRLAELRRSLPDLTDPSFASVACTADERRRVFTMRRGELLVVVNFGDEPAELAGRGRPRPCSSVRRAGLRCPTDDSQLPPHAGALLGPAGR